MMMAAVEVDCPPLPGRPTQRERAAAATTAASAVLAAAPAVARARVAPRWFAGAYGGIEPLPAVSSSKTVTIAKEGAAAPAKAAAAKAAKARSRQASSASRPASASSRRGGKRPASARSRRPLSSSDSRS